MSICGLTIAQPTIDYYPKQLQKTLHKNYSESDVVIKEIFIDGSKSSENFAGKFFEVYSDKDKLNFLYIGRVNSCRATGCQVERNILETESFEFFDYFILFDSLKNIISVKVYNYEASYGQEICSKAWLKQFVGYDGCYELRVGRNIDAISGASISSFNITTDIQEKTKILKTN